eukprot:jgi/Botrbrau1/20302/Bobra.31_1s0079.1
MQLHSPRKAHPRANRAAYSLTIVVLVLATLALTVNYLILSKKQKFCSVCELEEAFATLPLHEYSDEDRQRIVRRAALGQPLIDVPDRLAQDLGAFFGSLHSQYEPKIVCVNDSSLPGPPQQSIFLAGNLHDSEEVLPHYVAQLATLVALFPPNTVLCLSVREWQL